MGEVIFVLIDQDKLRRHVTVTLLSKFFTGIDVYEFDDAVFALEFIETAHELPQARIVILMDILLKGMTGGEVLHWLGGLISDAQPGIEVHIVTAGILTDVSELLSAYPAIKSIRSNAVTAEWLAATFPEHYRESGDHTG